MMLRLSARQRGRRYGRKSAETREHTRPGAERFGPAFYLVLNGVGGITYSQKTREGLDVRLMDEKNPIPVGRGRRSARHFRHTSHCTGEPALIRDCCPSSANTLTRVCRRSISRARDGSHE